MLNGSGSTDASTKKYLTKYSSAENISLHAVGFCRSASEIAGTACA